MVCCQLMRGPVQGCWRCCEHIVWYYCVELPQSLYFANSVYFVAFVVVPNIFVGVSREEMLCASMNSCKPDT